MALQLGALREALLDAGASQEKADKAAEEVACYENRLAGIETKLGSLDGDLHQAKTELHQAIERLGYSLTLRGLGALATGLGAFVRRVALLAAARDAMIEDERHVELQN